MFSPIAIGVLVCCNHATKAVSNSLNEFGIKSENVNQAEIQELNIASKISEGMTYREVKKIIPQIATVRPFDGEHGGVWYFVPLKHGFILSLRFEHSIDGLRPALGTKSLQDCKINLPPAVDVKRK